MSKAGPQRNGPGRPRKQKSLLVYGDILEIHERLRHAGLGRNEAVKETVRKVRELRPTHAISDTLVKNILAKCQPENSFLFEVGEPENWKLGVFRVEKEGDTYILKFSDRPQFRKRGKQINCKKIQFGRKKA